MLTRRDLLKTGTIAVAGLMLPWGCGKGGNKSFPSVMPDIITKYLDPLPVPTALQPIDNIAGIAYYEIKMTPFTQQLHKEFPLTNLWGYNNLYPGEVTRIIARFENYKGKYPFHCHIIEHEDNSMMSQFEVV